MNKIISLSILIICSNLYCQTNGKFHDLYSWTIKQNDQFDTCLFLFRQYQSSPLGTPNLIKFLRREFNIKLDEIKFNIKFS